MDSHGVFDWYSRGLSPCDGFFQPVTVPGGVILQHIQGQIDRVLNPNTAAAEGTDSTLEQMTLRSVVEVYIELVGKNEFDPAKGIPGAGLLSKPAREVSGVDFGPFHGGRIQQDSRLLPSGD
jgi:hypothetical protein